MFFPRGAALLAGKKKFQKEKTCDASPMVLGETIASR
jgi:hypothetical protein